MGTGEFELPDEPPPLPIVYIDWNVVQYLYESDAYSELLSACVEVKRAKAALLPYSAGHLFDATAGWHGLSATHRANRVRHMLFLDGLTSGCMCEPVREPGPRRFALTTEGVLAACDSRGLFWSMRGPDGLPAEDIEALDANVAKLADDVKDEIRRMADERPGLPRDLIDSMMQLLSGDLSRVNELSDVGVQLAKFHAALLETSIEQLQPFNHVSPRDAVAHLDKLLRSHQSEFGVPEIMALMQQQDPLIDGDAVGPMILGMYGYYRDRRQNIRAFKPGGFADHVHAQVALSSAIFITGEERLPKRVEAWAAYTGRGTHHGKWPIVQQASPGNDEAIQRAADIVRAYTRQFEGEIER